MEVHGGRLELDSAPDSGTKAIAIFPPERTLKEPSAPSAVAAA